MDNQIIKIFVVKVIVTKTLLKIWTMKHVKNC